MRSSRVAGHLQVNDLSKRFTVNGRPLDVLDRLRLSVAVGEFVTIVGASGCGKSTLLRSIAGLDPVFDGDIRLDGNRVTGPGLERGLVFQEPRLFPWPTVARNVGLG